MLLTRAVFVFVLLAFRASDGLAAAAPYYPERFDWSRESPAAVGMDAAALDEAVRFAVAHENQAPRDLRLAHAAAFGAQEPFDAPIGVHRERGDVSGLVVRRGRIVAEWGDLARADMAFSVTKTFLSTVVGVAWQKGLIRDVTDRVGPYMPRDVDLFHDSHNAPITWEHLLRQTSDWKGTLWGKPDWADRPQGKPDQWATRALHEPGRHYKYNDVRVNVLALAVLHVLRRPLPEVLREEVMDPIGASSTWRWHGYESSWIELDGRKVQSVSGGGHWGGGMFISALDMARFGYLFLRQGRWKDRAVVSETWIQTARTPGPANAEYGYMNWYLNTGGRPLPSTPASSVTFRGNGQNIVYVDWDNDLVVVVRWIAGGDVLDQFLGRVVRAIR